MIGDQEAVRRLTTICAGFEDSLIAYRNSGGVMDEGFNVMAELAGWVVRQAKEGDFTCFSELFEDYEAILSDATPDARQVLVIGFMEDLHNLMVRFLKPAEQINPDVLLKYLGPKSRAEWFSQVRFYLQRGETWPGQLA